MIDEKKLIEEMQKRINHAPKGEEVDNKFYFNCGFNNALIKIFDLIQSQPKADEWIPVTELDLDHNQEALIKLDDGFICSAKFLISDSGNNCGFYHKHIGFLQCPQVVEWMPYRKKVE